MHVVRDDVSAPDAKAIDMCYAQPGPRCTSHAKKALDAAIAEQTAIMAAIATPEVKAMNKEMWEQHKEWKAAYKAQHDRFPTREEETAWLDEQPYEKQYGARAKACHPAVWDAKDAYDATPGGIADMKATLADLEGTHGDAVLTVPLYVNTQARLAAAQKRRADQMAAYRRVHQAEPWTDKRGAAGGNDDVAAEDAAMSPPPPCSCIEYKYKQTCSHLTGRIEKARAHYIPTSHDASLALHAARSRCRRLEPQVEAAWAARGLSDAGSNARLDAMKDDPELDALVQSLSQAREDEIEAEEKFHGTPAGAALLYERAERREPCVGYGPSFFGGWDTIARNHAKKREQYAARFEEVTGESADSFVDDPRTPDLMYGAEAGCPERCKDFAWAAKCAHTDPEWGAARAFVTALQGTSEFKTMSQAMDKAFKPKRSGLMSRLLGR